MVWSDRSRTIFGENTRLSFRAELADDRKCGRVLLAGVAFCGWFRRGDFPCRLVPDPIGVKNSRLIDALVGMGAKVIALRLQQICRQARGTIAIEIGERGAESRRRHAIIDGSRNPNAPV